MFTALKTAPFSELEKAKRHAALAAAHRSCDIERLPPAGADVHALQARWADGELTMPQVITELEKKFRQGR